MATHAAADCTRDEVQAKLDEATEDGARVVIPSCAEGEPWDSPVSWLAPPNAVLTGSGSIDTGGGDYTLILDEYVSGSPLLNVQGNAVGTFRICGITFRAGSTQKDSGLLAFGGQSKQFRMDHVHLDAQTAAVPTSLVQFSNHVTGVVDHCILDLHSTGNGIKVHYETYGGGVSDQGERSFAAPTAFGTDDFIVLEDNIFNGNSPYSAINDSLWGGKMVVRFNTINRAWVQTHPARSGYGMGARATEVYGNLFISDNDFPIPAEAAFFNDSGASLMFINEAQEGYKYLQTGNSPRRSNDGGSHKEAVVPGGWGYCGPAPQTGIVDTVGTAVTLVSGDPFSISWIPGDMLFIGSDISGYRIASANSTTSITVISDGNEPDPGTQTGVVYTTGSNWDGNTDPLTGYPCIGQPGRGQMDLITGFFPNKVNATRGCDSSQTCANPRQALEPIYNFLNTWAAVPGYPGALFGSSDIVVLNRDYYLEDNVNCVSGGACTEGVGHGNTLPTTCTTGAESGGGVGFWKENEGNWRTATPSQGVIYGGQGVLYKCTATDTWTPYYTPLVYPHPLTAAGEGGPELPLAAYAPSTSSPSGMFL